MSDMQTQVIRTLLVDDHELFRNGIASMLNAQPDIEVVGEAGDGLEGRFRANALKPDLILLDINMPGMNGLEALELICADLPEVTVIMLTIHDEDEQLMKAIRGGAKGYILKNTNSEEFILMLRKVLKEGSALSPQLTSKVMANIAKSVSVPPAGEIEVPALTNRERDVLDQVAKGLSDKEIAKILGVSLHTVKSHIRNILAKLQVENRYSAVDLARKAGIIKPAD